MTCLCYTKATRRIHIAALPGLEQQRQGCTYKAVLGLRIFIVCLGEAREQE